MAFAAQGLLLAPKQITANLKAIPDQLGEATLSVTLFAGVDAVDAGIQKGSPFSWTADANDTLILNGVVLWQPSRFVGASALAGAQEVFPGAAKMPDALAMAADCAGLAAALGGYSGCDTACVKALCHDALEARWAAALNASVDAGQIGHLNVTATGPAELTDAAEPTGFVGSWVGSVNDGALSADVKGPIKGMTPVGSPP